MRVLNDWLLTSARVAIHLPTETAVAADLHLGYAQARQRYGDAVPVTTLDEELAPLGTVLAEYRIRRLVIAGDLFEAGPMPELVSELLAWLASARIELSAVVPGNHDRRIDREARLAVHPDGVDLAGWRVVHGNGPRPAGRVVQGHEHPLLRWGNGLTAACYLAAEDHLVLPAFSADAAGVNVLPGSLRSEYRCYAIAGEAVLDFGRLIDIRPRGRRQ